MEDESLSVTYRRLLQRIEPKLYVIPFAFILLRLWGTFQFIFSIAVFARGGTIDETGCVSPAVFYTYYALSCLQVNSRISSKTIVLRILLYILSSLQYTILVRVNFVFRKPHLYM